MFSKISFIEKSNNLHEDAITIKSVRDYFNNFEECTLDSVFLKSFATEHLHYLVYSFR